ncbi:SBF-like CPA transporter family-domain-containing protein [Cunninghamella echinulata]|nr:SBF-like CPA transporter family-domain-containing protein [Cunninghamella echinulata]
MTDNSKFNHTSATFGSEVTIPKPSLSPSTLKRKSSISNDSTYSEKSITIAPTSPSNHNDDNQVSNKEKFNKIKSRIIQLIIKYWFLLGLIFAIILAWQFPDVARKGGYIKAEWSIKWGAVIIIFLISGLSLRTKILAQTILRIRLHLLIQIINLLIIPGFVFGLVLLFFKLHMPLNSFLLIGVVIAASTPTTVSSNVVMTKNANGNEASALMNAALGNVLGIFVSPALVSVFQGPLIAATPEEESPGDANGKIDFISVLKQLGLTVLLPLIVGQIIQWFFTEQVAKIKVKWRLSDISSIALLTMVWSVFSDAVYNGSFSAVSPVDIVAVAIMNAGFYILFSLLSWFLAYLPIPYPGPAWLQNLRYSREDTVAVMYCGATKTVAMGVPLINVLYQNGNPGTVGVLSTPLLLYHVEQLILGNFEVEILKKWVKRGQEQQEMLEKDQDDDNKSIIIPAPPRDDEEIIYSSDTTQLPNNHSLLNKSSIFSSTVSTLNPFAPAHHKR